MDPGRVYKDNPWDRDDKEAVGGSIVQSWNQLTYRRLI